ncbi:Clp protease N-terminal domain-containing protein [Mycobacterium sp. LTG2003]
MFERFTNSARLAVIGAQSEARSLNHAWIGTEHILLGVMGRGRDDSVAQLLDAAGLEIDAVRERVKQIFGVGDEEPPGHIPFTGQAKEGLESSLRESMQLGHPHIGPDHMLLGILLVSDGGATEVLTQLGADVDGLVQEIRRPK